MRRKWKNILRYAKLKWKMLLQYASVFLLSGGLLFILVETVKAKNTGFETKTLWDWMELLIIPLALAGGALYLQQSERAVERKTTEDHAKLEREIATDRQQEAALQAYLDRMADLLVPKESDNESNWDVARIRTLTVLRVLDTKRKGIVLLFLDEAGLIDDEGALISLAGADFSKVELERYDLSGANLSEANLSNARLYSANLLDANLSKADLTSAYLGDTDLSNADLRGAKVSDLQLSIAKSLKDAIMPDEPEDEEDGWS
jgi:hypothetical protein